MTSIKSSESNESLPDFTAKHRYDSNDILDFPLPDIPVKKERGDVNTISSSSAKNKDYQHSSLPITYKANRRGNEHLKPVPLQRTLTENTISGDRKADNREQNSADENMHYHNPHEKPKYLFGDPEKHGRAKIGDDIFLNKSGWVQVSHRSFEKSPERNEKKRFEYTKGLSVAGLSTVPTSRGLKYEDNLMSYKQQQNRETGQRSVNNLHRAEQLMARHAGFSRNSKIDDLISRNEARRLNVNPKRSYSIDPQISAILNERPGFLPVKRLTDRDSPPPITPIISPPPAFQDSKAKTRSQANTKFQLTVNNHDNRSQQPQQQQQLQPQAHSNKGMVFSRSFEYDNRKTRDYKENFSKSFDYDLSTTSAADRMKSKMFTNLTGVSPNYLTKKETTGTRSKSNSRDASPVFQQKQLVEPFKTKTRVRNTLSVRPEKFMSLDEPQGRSRRAQFSKLHHESTSSSGSQGFRSVDNSAAISAANRRLNSCDSGARSG